MKSRSATYLILALLTISACRPVPEQPALPALPETEGQYAYQIGLGYGFLDRYVRVLVDGREKLSLTGTPEIEEFAQLLGTKILAGGSSEENVILVQVFVDEAPPVEATLDLNDGGIIHIYSEQNGIKIFNTRVLILE